MEGRGDRRRARLDAVVAHADGRPQRRERVDARHDLHRHGARRQDRRQVGDVSSHDQPLAEHGDGHEHARRERDCGGESKNSSEVHGESGSARTGCYVVRVDHRQHRDERGQGESLEEGGGVGHRQNARRLVDPDFGAMRRVFVVLQGTRVS